MIYTPEKYSIADKKNVPFIDSKEIWDFINTEASTPEKVREVIKKSLSKKRLSLQETAILINTNDPVLIEEIKEGARQLKENVYGDRIVLFAPLYVGNLCINNCVYCGFQAKNKDVLRVTLEKQDLQKEATALVDSGHKRLILVYGEHPHYSPEFIADSVRTVYGIKSKNGEIRRVNINAAPLDVEGFKTVKESGIGTYQVFQETYHPEAYSKVHLGGIKKDFDWRLTSLDRAQEAGIDDVGIGALFGLYDWRFEVMSLVRHVNHFEAVFNVGPHTISFPRIQNASALNIDKQYLVSDENFVKLVAILRLAVPYTGMILTARESAEIRDQVLRFGISQIDGGTNLEIGGYSKHSEEVQDLNKEQFQINDTRSLNEIIEELISKDYIPSFCTACYRLGRTGEHFMEFSVPGFIKRFCAPNAILTIAEYLEDYASFETKAKGYKMIERKLEELSKTQEIAALQEKLNLLKQGQRDLYF
ncbi:MAG: [FeFe] hydrogenase H-cluster radical SAM maturase HydG [Bacteroidetes bacterium]|nr:[FeFe] hydrogenase H-cluster radical SAM maturase HydG [Bacteroidota bacterium]